MSSFDWEGNEFAVSVSASQSLVSPPKNVLFTAIGILLISVASFFVSSVLGYVLGVIASIVGGFVVFLDLKRRSDPNYMSLSWFTPAAIASRYLILAVTLLHILRLAIASAR